MFRSEILYVPAFLILERNITILFSMIAADARELISHAMR